MTGPTGRRAGTLRLFFALWPADSWRSALAAVSAPVVAQVAGLAVPPGNLHVTLAFLGPVPGTALAPLFEVGRQGPWPAVELEFQRLEYWAKPKVLVAMSKSVPAAGLAIVERLWTALERQDYARETRPWRPHLTLARRIRRPPPENLVLAPVAPVGDEPPWRLALVESSAHPEGPRYKPRADWPIG